MLTIFPEILARILVHFYYTPSLPYMILIYSRMDHNKRHSKRYIFLGWSCAAQPRKPEWPVDVFRYPQMDSCRVPRSAETHNIVTWNPASSIFAIFVLIKCIDSGGPASICSLQNAPMPYPPACARDRPESQNDELDPNHSHFLLLDGDWQCAGAEPDDLRVRKCKKYAEIMKEAGHNLNDIAQKVYISYIRVLIM